MMQNQKSRRLVKFLLLASLSLTCVAATEAGQQMVKAIGLEMVQVTTPMQASSTPSAAAPSGELAPTTASTTPAKPPVAKVSVAKPAAAKPQVVSQVIDSSVAQTRRQALNTGAGGQPVQQMSSSQIAAATWQGASFPVEDFQAYTSPFGYRSSPDGGYSQEFHYGLDMAAPEGSYIRTWWSGKVVEVSDDSNCGTSVVIDSGDWTHIYCHMQGHVETENGKKYMIDREGGIQIWEDQQIQAGARLGRVGMTGRTTGPHLHWGLKYDKNWVDPALVLRAMYNNQQTDLSQRQTQ
jgi:murein DD-endopeptidase MepM/ murein hydrolase activator NlpD